LRKQVFFYKYKFEVIMKEYIIDVSELKSMCNVLKAGDRVLLSGTVYTARDAAHKRIFEMIDNNQKLPFDICGSVVYYAGPTPTPPNLAIGSCGPTTSSRMDRFAPKLYDMGMIASVGKGDRSQDVYDSIVRNGAVYLCAIGGAGALASECITECEVVAFDDLGCESVKRLIINNFPLTVAIDSCGNSLFR